MFWFMEGTCFLPFFLVIWSSSTFIISYIIAVIRKDVDVIFPYISDTGAEPPESGVFGLMTTVTAFTSMVTMFARYKYVQTLQKVVTNARPRLNLAALWCGLISSLGMCIVGTFQVTKLQYAHDAGALVFFIFGVTYMILQSVISYFMHPDGSSMAVCHVRAIISGISVLAAFPMIICAMLEGNMPTKLHWDPTEMGFIPHVVSTACEWVVTFGFVIFFLSYIREFKRFTLTLTAVMLASN
ncbi:hypothetical protein SKAU_G00046240 [Synaphobranchus kaupii]|uniref:CWH43-like N-terminal domain-containing protein n=1 Tax=Synaphobranchus kaupii TaxID=118154 RepID=A0A9Q1G249_SYNKA|nr:hypothetical protein SKAU_G00046240 [Synaphobranchus kaupii]